MPRVSTPVPLLTRNDLRLVAGYATLCVGLGYWLGQDLNWDLLNYHFYNPYQVIHGRFERDVHAAGVQSFHNPLLDFPLYGAVRLGVPPIAFFLWMSAVHGLALWTVHRITLLLVPDRLARFRTTAGLLAAGTSALGAGYLSMLGNTMGDNVVALPLLLALLLLLRAVSADEAQPITTPFVLAGLLAGGAVGAKLAVGPIAMGLLAMALAVPGHARARGTRATGFAAGGAAGVLLAGGYWMWLMYHHFGSPVFPYFNEIFQSPFAPPLDLSDQRFVAGTAFQKVFYPFFWIGTQNLVLEPAFRDGRCAAALLALAATALAAAFDRLSGDAGPRDETVVRLRLLAVFWLVSYVAWLQLFSYYRYIVVLELLGAPVIIGTAMVLTRRGTATLALAVPVCVALAVGARPPDWGRIPWSDSYFGVDPTALAKYEGATILMWDMPQAYVVPFFPPSTTFVRLLSNKGLVPGNAMWTRLEAHVAGAPDDRLYKLDMLPGSIHEKQEGSLAHFGLVATDACEMHGSHAGPFRICRLERRRASGN
ncbi:MAG: hypothetical protein IT177_06805 [Acidobacteria bacterium]|nr:hypothetical protein [Acidobacteriota bacterium]